MDMFRHDHIATNRNAEVALGSLGTETAHSAVATARGCTNKNALSDFFRQGVLRLNESKFFSDYGAG
jgi:hypothetical protein